MAGLLLAATAADAQPIGTFSWQTQPYCNVITVQVLQHGPMFQLIGTDDLCGAGTAPVTGTAVFAGGTVAFGLTAALPSGRAAQISVIISLVTLSGTWTDADGNTGVFAFGAHATGPGRPEPARATAITVAQFSSTVYAGTGAATTVARSDHDHDTRYYTQAQTDARLPEVVFTGTAPAPTLDFSVAVHPFATTRAGRLELQMQLLVTNAVCGAGVPSWYLLVDGAAVPSSSLRAANYIGYVAGVTAAVLPAGNHTVGIAADCPTGPLTFGAGGSVAVPGQVSIVVLP